MKQQSGIMIRSPRWLAALVSGLALSAARATDIIWDIDLRGTNNHVRSTGQKFGEGFVFELGVFTSGFVPTQANIGQWAANWTAASRGPWNASLESTSGTVSFTSNPAPFTAGAPAWLWGMRGQEWVLLRKSSWLWPVGSGTGGPATTWTADGTVTMTAGSVVNTASTFTYTSALVSANPPPLCYADWQKLHFTSAEVPVAATSGPDADPDGDGAGNMREYLTFTDPKKRASAAQLDAAAQTVGVSGAGYLAISLRTDPRACFQFTAQRTEDLVSWANFSGVTVTNTPGLLIVRDTAPQSMLNRAFLRLNLSPAP